MKKLNMLLNNGQRKGAIMRQPRMVEFKGEHHTIDALAKQLSLSKTAIIYRLDNGISLDEEKSRRRRSVIIDANGMRACPDCGTKYEYKNKQHKCGKCLYKQRMKNMEYKKKRMVLHGW